MKPILLFLFTLVSISLSGQNKPEIIVTNGHQMHVTNISFHPNNNWIATGSIDGTVRVWSKSLQREMHVLYGHSGAVTKVGYTSNGKQLITSDNKGFIYIWDTKDYKLIIKRRLSKASDFFEYLAQSDYYTYNSNDSLFLQSISNSQEPARFIAKAGFVTQIASSPKSGKYLGYHDLISKKILLFDWKKDMNAPVYTVAIEGYQQQIRINHQDNQIATLNLAQKVLHLAKFGEGNEGEPLRSIVVPDTLIFKISDIEFSPDGTLLALLTMGGDLYLYNTQTLKQEKRIKTGASYTPEMAFHPKDPFVGISGWYSQIDSSKRGRNYSTFLSVNLYNPYTEKSLGDLRGYPKIIGHLSVDSTDTNLQSFHIIDKLSGMRSWNLREGDLERFTESFSAAASTANGQMLAVLLPDLKTRSDSVECAVLKLPEHKKVFSVMASTVRNIALSPDGRYLVFESSKIDLKNPINNKFYLQVWDIEKKKRLSLTPLPLHQISMMAIGFFRVDPSCQYVLSQSPDTLYTRRLSDGTIVSRIFSRWESGDGKYRNAVLDFSPQQNAIVIGASVVTDFTRATMRTEMVFSEWDYTTGTALATYPTGVSGFFASGDFHPSGKYLVTGHEDNFGLEGFPVLIWDWASKKVICTLSGHYGNVRCVWYGNKGERVYSAADDGFIKIWDVNNCQLIGSMLAMEQTNYLLLSPDGYYKTSKNNHDGLCFKYKEELYGFDQFDLYFNRPDKVLAHFGLSRFALQLYTKAWEKRVARLGYDKELLDKIIIPDNLPRVVITNKNEIPVGTQENSINIDLLATDSLTPLQKLHISINGVPMFTAKGLDLEDKNTYKARHNVALASGKNIIKVSVVNALGLESFREEIEINHIVSSSAVLPDLYILTVAVSNFQDSSRNLRYTRRDAESIVETFNATKNKQYANVYHRSLTDAQATKSQILEQAAFLKQAKIDDVVLVFISTHGLIDDNFDYYLATHNTNFNNPAADAIAYQDIDKQLLDGLPCLNRLVMLDACHSGEIDRDEAVLASNNKLKNQEGTVTFGIKSGNDYVRPKAGVKDAFNYMQQLFTDVAHSTGSTVIAAAGGYEFAIESDVYSGGHGVFTYSVLEALSNSSHASVKKADYNEDSKVSVSELHRFVAAKVVELTNGKQRPTTRQENGLNDFILFK